MKHQCFLGPLFLLSICIDIGGGSDQLLYLQGIKVQSIESCSYLMTSQRIEITLLALSLVCY